MLRCTGTRADALPRGGSAGANAEVDYTLRRYVKRRPSGHPGQVIYTDFKTTVARPDAHPELLKRKNAD